MKIRFYEKPVLRSPIMVAGWPGIGHVAIGAAKYLQKKLDVKLFAEVESSTFFTYEGVAIRRGVASLPRLPDSKFYYFRSDTVNDLIIFVGEAQPHGRGSEELANILLDLAEEFNVKRIYTGAAFPTSIYHREEPKVWAVANDESLLSSLTNYNVRVLKQGSIAGLNGLLLGFAKQRGINGICLLGETPVYTVNIENPKSSKAILEVLIKMLGIKIDMYEIETLAKNTEGYIEKELEHLYEQMKGRDKFKPEVMTDEEPDKVPFFVKQRIEQLFVEAKKDKNKATELKKELDRWDLFEEYEDRFLDLFKKRG
jgi:uncharacterized protein (TIGR00162 family)